MTDVCSGNTSDEDSTEMKKLKKEFPPQSKLDLNLNKLRVPSGNPSAAAGTIIQKSYTVQKPRSVSTVHQLTNYIGDGV